MKVMLHLLFLIALWGNVLVSCEHLTDKTYDATVVGRYIDPHEKGKQYLELQYSTQRIEKVSVDGDKYSNYKVGDSITNKTSHHKVYGKASSEETYAWISLIVAGVITLIYVVYLLRGSAGGVLDSVGDVFSALD